MPSTLPHISRGMRRVSFALVGVVLLSACDTDQPLAPRTATPPVSPQLAKGGGGGGGGNKTGTFVITIVDENDAQLTVAGAKIVGFRSAEVKFEIMDNGQGDENAAVGVVQVSGFATGQYQICQPVAPAGYLHPDPTCQNVNLGRNGPTQIEFVDVAEPHATFVTRDGITHDSVGGVWFTVDWGAGPVVISDNSLFDLDKRDGVLDIKIANNGTSVEVCPKSVPVGRTLSTPLKGCVTKTVNGATDFGAWNVNPEYSIYWWAMMNGNDAPSGTYTITAVGGGFTKTVTNGGASDMAAGTRVYVTVPAEGLYNVCQTVAPAGAQLAQPSCREVLVEFAVPSMVETFQNQPL